ncbi:hypothetical protein INT45_005623 [Circinella minor]|uniref:No apical meristem-associated C-terminal domain-containing protein n=1 Tax=Circinella minor TaxID=1195481 RepID=A0A8H7S9Q4_9FUNG|nr:hypothetical protein INT45_005623 [Circinella minor]
MKSNTDRENTNVTPFINSSNTTPTTTTTTISASVVPNSADGASNSDTNDNDGTVVNEQEDLKLVNAWCSVSKDSVRGAEDKEQGLWGHVLEVFVSTRNPNNRDWNALKNHWGIISKTCSAFSAAFVLAREKKESGESEDDVIAHALKIYESDPPKRAARNFRYMRFWHILKRQHKWRAFLEKVKDLERPMGKKKVKAVEQSKKRRLDEGIDEGEGVSMEVTLLREQIKLDRARLKILERAEDISIMDRDISTYTGARLKFFKHLQDEIMKKYFDEE